MMNEYRVGAASEIPEGGAVAVDIGDRRIAVFRHRGKLYALDETCPHRGGPLHRGAVEGGVVICPWHHWRFELASGRSPVNPLSKVRTYPVRVEGDDVLVEL